MFIDLIIFSSSLHDRASVLNSRKELFSNIQSFSELRIFSCDEYFSEENGLPSQKLQDGHLTVCFIATGGTEEIFTHYYQRLLSPIILLSDGYHNSFAASFEIATWLNQNSIPHELINVPLESNYTDFLAFKLSCLQIRHILNGMSSYFHTLGEKESEEEDYALTMIYEREEIKQFLSNTVIGLIGGESSWLISSGVDCEYISKRFGTRFVNIDIAELIDDYHSNSVSENSSAFNDAKRMYSSLKKICSKYSLTALTIKCFDLLDTCHTTACYALSQLNDEGIISGCEGDIPALWTMILIKAMTGKASFMANPSSSSPSEKSIDFAHCTIPLSLTTNYTFPSHFESGIGIAIAGELEPGYYSLFKIGGRRLSKLYLGNGVISTNTHIEQRCRTQVKFVFNSTDEFNTFLNNRLGNHIILISGGCV